MGSTTVSKPVENDLVADLTEEALADLYKGAPDSFSDPGEETEPIDSEMVAAPPVEFPNDAVMLTNIRHKQEEIFIPDPGTNTWSGRKVMFVDHRLITDPATAEVVKAACPYVYEENLSIPAAQWHAYRGTGFRTTSTQGYDEYARQQAENS